MSKGASIQHKQRQHLKRKTRRSVLVAHNATKKSQSIERNNAALRAARNNPGPGTSFERMKQDLIGG